MKQFTTILLIALLPFVSNADTRKTAEMRVSNDLVMEIIVQLDSPDKALPKSWDDFESIGMMKNGLLKHQLFRAKTMNSFALVPGAPVIDPQLEISREIRGHRLFLISREEKFIKSQGHGRYVILVKPEELDSKPIRIFSHFIPEETAEQILNKIPDFDPAEQPLAFDDLSPFEQEQKQYHESVRKPGDPPPDEADLGGRLRQDAGPPSMRSSDDTTEGITNVGWIAAVSVVCFLLLLLAVYRLRKPKARA
jgi:hypothetical protein